MPVFSVTFTEEEFERVNEIAEKLDTSPSLLVAALSIECLDNHPTVIEAVGKQLAELEGGRNRRRPISSEVINKIVAEMQADPSLTITMMAKRYNIERNTLSSKLWRLGFSSGSAGRPARYTDDELQVFANMKKAGSDWEAVSKAAGMTVAGIRAALSRQGLI